MATAAISGPPASPNLSPVERARRGVVPLIALLAACLGVLCLVNLAKLPSQLHQLAALTTELGGWAAVAYGIAAGVALAAVATAPQVRAAAPLAVGTAAAVFGLALGHDVRSDVQLALALLMLGLAAGALLGGSVCLTVEPDVPARTLTAVGWSAPLVGAPGVLDWLALRTPSRTLELTLHPPLWPVAVISLLLVGWSALTLLVEPDPAAGCGRSAEPAWTALVTATTVPLIVAMLVGFQSDVSATWLRPLAIAVSGAAAVGAAFTCVAQPTPAARRGCAVAFALLLPWPSTAALLFRAAPVASGTGMVLALLAGVLAGAVWGLAHAFSAVVLGQVLVAGSAVGLWAALDQPALLPVAFGVLCCSLAAAVTGAVRGALPSPVALRPVGGAAVVSVLLGTLLGLPLAWALGGAVPSAPDAAAADARVLLGLLVAAALLSAGYTATSSATPSRGSSRHDD